MTGWRSLLACRAMVRREDTGLTEGRPTGEAASRCAVPAGENPARVVAGEPDSRPAPTAERPKGEAWCHKPLRAKADSGKQARGPQHQVKPAASKDSQSESRAAHVPAKATFPARESGWAGSLGGVLGAAREQGAGRNTRGPSAPWVRPQRRPNKPMAKWVAVQRESEGVVVPVMVTQKNVTGGKGLCCSRAEEETRREGLPRANEAKHPFGHRPVVLSKALDSIDQLRGVAKSKSTQAVRRGLSVSRMREIRTYGLSGGLARGSEFQRNIEIPAGGRIYQ